MSHRVWWPLAVLALVVATPRAAAAQHCFSFAGPSPCGVATAGPWANLDFRAAIASADSAKATSHWQWPPSGGHRVILDYQGHRMPSVFGTAPQVFENTMAPIDCAFVRHGDPALDPKMVVRPPAHITHSGVVIVQPPCRVR